MFKDFSALIMDRMAFILDDRMKEASKEASKEAKEASKEASKEAKEASKEQSQEMRNANELARKEQSQEMSSILDKHLISLQEKIDERVETGVKQATKGLTVRFETAQEQTGKRNDDVAGQASALSKRLDNDQAERKKKPGIQTWSRRTR